LIKKTLSLIEENSSTILGNGKITKIWEEKIIGNPPIAYQENLHDLRRWMKIKVISNMEEISHCSDGDWDDWRIHNIPQCLVPQWKNLISHLKGATPLS